MKCPKCKKSMRPAVFMEYWLCEKCDQSIKFTKKEKEEAKKWIKNRRRRMKRLIPKTLPVAQLLYRINNALNPEPKPSFEEMD